MEMAMYKPRASEECNPLETLISDFQLPDWEMRNVCC